MKIRTFNDVNWLNLNITIFSGGINQLLTFSFISRWSTLSEAIIFSSPLNSFKEYLSGDGGRWACWSCQISCTPTWWKKGNSWLAVDLVGRSQMCVVKGQISWHNVLEPLVRQDTSLVVGSPLKLVQYRWEMGLFRYRRKVWTVSLRAEK